MISRTPAAVALVIALAPSAARADGAREEVATGGSWASATSPGSTWISDKLAGMWDADDKLQMRVDLSATHAYGNAGSITGEVLNAAASVDYTIDDHWSVHGAV